MVSLFLCIYSLSYSGVFRADDEHILASRAVSLALRGEWEEPQVFGNERIQSLMAFGDAATQIEPAQTLIGAGLISLARVAALGQVQALFSLNVYLTALTAGTVFLIVRVLSYSRVTAAWCAVLFGAATMAWPYATTLYRDVLAMFLASLAFLGWALIFVGDEKRRLLGGLLTVIGISGGILAKNSAAALLPAFAIYGIVLWARSAPGSSARRRLLFGATVGIVFLILGSAALPMRGPLARFSYAYYLDLAAHFWKSAGPELPLAFAGPFLSPAKSLLVYSPPLLIAILGIRSGIRSHPWFVIPAISFALLIALAQALFYGELWSGALSWGPRFMLPALPPLVVLAAPVIDRAIRGRRSMHLIGLSIVLLAGVVIQLGGAIVGWNQIYRDWLDSGLKPFSSDAAWNPQFLPIPGQLNLLFNPSSWTVAWQRSLLGGVSEAIVAPIAAGALAASIVVIWLKFGLGDKLAGGLPRLFSLVIALAVVLPSLPLWWSYRGDPYWGRNRREFAEALGWVSSESASGDVFVLGSYGTPLWSFWLNWWSREEPWYSLAYEIPSTEPSESEQLPSDLTTKLMSSIEDTYSRMWYASSGDSPGHGLRRESKWLSARYTLKTQRQFESDSVEVEVGLYDLPRFQDR